MIREKLKNKIKENFNFIYNEKFCVEESEEAEYIIEDIIYEMKKKIMFYLLLH